MSAPNDRMTTYKRADGELICDYSWVNDMEYLDDMDDPVELVEERWVMVERRTFWHMPDRLYACTKVVPCDEDAVAWEQIGDEWVQTCAAHAAPVAVPEGTDR